MQATGNEEMAVLIHFCVQRFLRRWQDPVTLNDRDDLAQEAAWLALRHLQRLRDRSRLPAVARTISRRLRCRILSRAWLRGELPVAEGWEPADREPDAAPSLRIGGAAVARSCLLELLPQVLGVLSETNRSLVEGFYGGRDCSQLAERFGLTVDAVKVRLHRSRRRLRREFEVRARAAGLLDG